MDSLSPSDESISRTLRWGCAIVLVCSGLALLALTAWQEFRPREQTTAVLPAQTMPATGDALVGGHPPDGKVLPVTPPATGITAIPPAIDQSAVPPRAESDLEQLFTAVAPPHDYFATAEELGHVVLGDRTVWSVDYRVGERATFQTADGPREAELIYMDDPAAYWVETGLSLDRSALIAAAGRMHDIYYPTLSRNFGQEWRPGIDGDLRFTVLHVLGAPGTLELGYFTDEDQYPRSLFEHSNEREMIYLNMGRLPVDSLLYDGTLVHEVQHLIQWNLDANEDKWLNEGLSQIAEDMAGLDTVDPAPYLEQTNIRLDRWSKYAPEIYAHYGGSFLYLLYLRQQAGVAALTELARHPANGLAAVRAILAGYLPRLSLEEFTLDWATALLLDGESADPRYSFDDYDLPRPFFANRVRQLPYAQTGTVDQYAIDFIDLDFYGRATITFAGDTTATLTDEPPGGAAMWFAPPINSGRSQLTGAVDLTGIQNAELTFAAWYDLEPLYDFAYLSVSTDNGATWRVLEPNHGVLGAYGSGWGGRSAETSDHSNGWVAEQIDLTPYAGTQIMLRFDVVTDFEESGRGFAVSGLTIPQLAKQPEWWPNGFVETGHLLPQRWGVRVIKEGSAPKVIPLTLDALNRGSVGVELGPEGGTLIVMPLTPYVDSAADYWLSVEK